ncbi:arsenate-mycothiol transferase ArsC [Yunchengibacter salinarum]|uniref:arsenate-mycothiol transferase ArsC n=1 Tax=Yunchengibacter salinarum TaxID=3133399 RepID=UPI0035B5ED76
MKSLLFVCNQNAVRSPMAEALARQMAAPGLHVASVGLVPGMLDPFSVAVMREAGIDIADHAPRALNRVDLADFDRVVALTDGALGAMQRALGPDSGKLLHWPIPDPGADDGSRAQLLAAYRSVRDQLKRRIAALLAEA